MQQSATLSQTTGGLIKFLIVQSLTPATVLHSVQMEKMNLQTV